MFNFGRSRELDEFAVALARQFAAQVPPDARPKAGQQVARAVDEICVRAKEFKKEKRLGIYGRARVGTAFKLELKNTGYPREFVEDFTHQLLLSMSGK